MSIENALLICQVSKFMMSFEVSQIFSSLILYSTIYICEFRSYLEPKLTIKQVQGSTAFDARF